MLLFLTFVPWWLPPIRSAIAAAPRPDVVDVRDDATLRAALRDARAGTTIRVNPGAYRGGIFVERLTGTSDAPIVIEGTDPANPPVFVGGDNGMHLVDPAHVTLRHLVFRNQTANGINIDDGGTFDSPARHVRLEHVRVEEVGPHGNRDGIKLSGVDDFAIVDCHVEGWGGSAIDMVGCHRGRIERCAFVGRDGFDQATGPQAKGGSSDIVISRCRFERAGSRAVNVGGSTGLAFFRPADATYEARDITVEHCTFVGSAAPVAFVGVDGATVARNTIYLPERWVLRILQETTEPRFVPSRNGRFTRNLVVFRADMVRSIANVGPGTSAETFEFSENFWFCQDDPAQSRPTLPAEERGGVYGIDPKLDGRGGRVRVGNPEVRGYGAEADAQE